MCRWITDRCSSPHLSLSLTLSSPLSWSSSYLLTSFWWLPILLGSLAWPEGSLCGLAAVPASASVSELRSLSLLFLLPLRSTLPPTAQSLCRLLSLFTVLFLVCSSQCSSFLCRSFLLHHCWTLSFPVEASNLCALPPNLMVPCTYSNTNNSFLFLVTKCTLSTRFKLFQHRDYVCFCLPLYFQHRDWHRVGK